MSSRPNILLIHADQHRFDCLGTTGNTDIVTPVIDTLASEGVVFENTFCPYPVCTPSRYSLLTGLYARQHLGWSNHSTIPQGLPTFPRTLSENGYRTAAVGKMHFTPTYLDVGFQTMILAEQNGPGRYDDDYHRWLKDEGLCPCVDLMDQEREFRGNASEQYWETGGGLESDLDEEHHSTTWIAERALEQLAGWSPTDPSMLMVGFVKPHHPFDPPAPWSNLYEPETLEILPGWTESPCERDLNRGKGYFNNAELSEHAVRQAMAGYYASISQIDFQVGRMLELLKQRGLYDNTLVIYTSDHGEYLGFHHLLLKGNHLYDPLAKIPFIVKFPQGERAGERHGRQVSTLDLAPSILRCAGCPVPKTMRGLDLTNPESGRPLVFCEDANGSQIMVRSQSRKLLFNAQTSECLLFDLEKDPCEHHNCASDPAYRKDLGQLCNSIMGWLLSDACTPVHLDERAPRVNAANVPLLEDHHRRQTHEFFQKKMAEFDCPVIPEKVPRLEI